MKRSPLKRCKPLSRRTRLAQRSARPGPACLRLLDRAWRQAVYDRDGHRCQLIGVNGHTCSGTGLDAHHIKSKAAFPELRHVVKNGIALCRKAHCWAHDDPTGFAKLFPERMP